MCVFSTSCMFSKVVLSWWHSTTSPLDVTKSFTLILWITFRVTMTWMTENIHKHINHLLALSKQPLPLFNYQFPSTLPSINLNTIMTLNTLDAHYLKKNTKLLVTITNSFETIKPKLAPQLATLPSSGGSWQGHLNSNCIIDMTLHTLCMTFLLTAVCRLQDCIVPCPVSSASCPLV